MKRLSDIHTVQSLVRDPLLWVAGPAHRHCFSVAAALCHLPVGDLHGLVLNEASLCRPGTEYNRTPMGSGMS
jgi:hypothetical protein